MKRFKTQQIYLLFIFILGSFFIAGCGGGGDVTGHWLPARQLMSIQVTPITASVPVTGNQQFTATATYTDGVSLDVTKTATWTSGTPANASVVVNTGLATGLVGGTSSVITATYGGKSGSGTLNVNAATSISFRVTPVAASIPVTGTQRYTAIETFSDGTIFDRTAAATWSSNNTARAGILTGGVTPGLATGITPGAVIITATLGALSATANLTVTAATSVSFRVVPIAASIPVTGTQQYTAIETFSDGTTFDRTAAATWSSNNTARAGILTGGVTPGLATGITPGAVIITATLGALSATANLTVTAATSVSFRVMPIAASIPVTGTQRYTAIETFSDGTTFDRTAAATWSSSNTARAGILTGGVTPGLATGVTPGAVVITATLGALSATANLTVTAATSVSFMVIPATASIPVSGTQQYTAIETFSDGTTQDRTAASAWTSPDLSGSGVATISNTSPTIGRATGAAIGTSTITATYTVSGITKTATAILTVTAATSVSFVVTPATASITINGGSQQFVAIETFSDGTTQNRTTASTWTAVDLVPVDAAGVAIISNTSPTIGVATGVNRGTSTITATYTVGSITKTATAILTVTAPNPGPAAPYPILGTAATYGMIASDAMTIAATALTHIYGDVALINNDSFVGFSLTGSGATLDSIYTTPQTIPGINSKTLGDPTAAVKAQFDLNAAYVDLSARTPLTTAPTSTAGGTYPAGVVELSGKVLVPGIYRIATRAATDTFGLSSINGPLVLDAKGNPDALFILQASDITTTTGSVLLQGGAQAKNVYWVMTNTATIGDGTGTIFQGTVVAGGTITVKGANVQGRMLAGALGAGAITISAPGSVITVPK